MVPESTSDPIVELENVSIRFEMDRGVARVVDEADLTLEREEIFGLVGESGSGKSMLASSMLDAVEDPGVLSGEVTYYPESGEPVDVLDLSGEELRRLRWEEIAMVFQGALDSFNPTLTIRQHFHETLSAHDEARDVGMERAENLLESVYLEPEKTLDSYPHELSGGMKQRALIALALVLEPQMLVMDEPTGALDLLMQRSILSLIKKLQRRYELTILFISHDLPLVSNLADRIGVMYAFELIEVGTAKDVIENARHPYARALLKAVPNLRMPFEEMTPIEGDAPDPVDVPEGCSYAPRCPLADQQCRTEDPRLDRLDGAHYAACFHTDESPDAVALDVDAAQSPADDDPFENDPLEDARDNATPTEGGSR